MAARSRRARHMDLWMFAMQLDRHAKNAKSVGVKNPQTLSNSERKNLTGRHALLCIADPKEGQPKFTRRTHMVSTLLGCKAEKWVVQARNQSGDPEKPEAENTEDLELLPDKNAVITLKNGTRIRVVEYNLAANTVQVEPATAKAAKSKRKAKAKSKSSSNSANKRQKKSEASDESKSKAENEASDDKSKKQKSKSKNDSSAESKARKSKGKLPGKHIMYCTPAVKRNDCDLCYCCPHEASLPAKPKSIARRKKKAMDKPTTSSTESVEESRIFTVDTVLKSFTNPRDDLFNRSCPHVYVFHILAPIYAHAYMSNHICVCIYEYTHIDTHILLRSCCLKTIFFDSTTSKTTPSGGRTMASTTSGTLPPPVWGGHRYSSVGRAPAS